MKIKTYINNNGYNYENIIYQPYLISKKSFEWIGEIYLKEKIIAHNDLIILFAFLRMQTHINILMK